MNKLELMKMYIMSTAKNTKKYNQIYNYTSYSVATKGVTCKVTNGVISLTGTTDSTGNGCSLAGSTFSVTTGHKFFIKKYFNLVGNDYLFDQYNLNSTTNIENIILTSKTSYLIPQIKFTAVGNEYNITNGNLAIVDLTEIYGEGNEPATPQEFLEDYPEFNNFVPYKPI